MSIVKRSRLTHYLAAVALVPLAVGSANAKDIVLVMTIAKYSSQPLGGVKHDSGNALEIARLLGYDTSQPQIFKDEQLTAPGLKAAIGSLSAQVQRNDRVFVYFSGHGYSQRLGEQCVQTLVGQDGGLVSTTELNTQLDLMKTRTSDVLVLIDACHSGGLREMTITRGGGSATSELTDQTLRAGLSPKVFQAKAGESCSNPVNFAKAWEIPPGAPNIRAAFPQNNFTFLAAAGEREVALDDETRGGLATVSLLDCLRSGVPDLDGSGAVSTQEWVNCAQQRLVDDIPKLNDRHRTRWAPHTIEGHGNVDRALVAVKAIDPPSSPVDPRGRLQGNRRPLSVLASRTLSAFEQVVASSDGNWNVSVDMPSAVKMGSKARVRYASLQHGYLSVLYVGSDGQDIQALNTNLPIEAGSHEGEIPIVDCPGGCAGENTFLFVFSARPFNSKAWLEGTRVGERLTISSQLLKNLQCAAGASRKRNASALELTTGPCAGVIRNASSMESAKSAPVDGYAARLVVVRGY